MTKRYIIYSIITAAWGLLNACSLIYDDVEEANSATGKRASAYVSLVLRTGGGDSVTRSNPTGGEEGDGYEKGQSYENAISNISLFFYPSITGGGINGANVDFAAVYYVANITSTTVGPLEVEGLEANQPYRVLAVANAGDLRSYTSLDDLRNATLQDVCQSNNGTYNSFVMASENDDDQCELTIDDGNSYSNPATATIDLERLAARVDYQVENNNFTLDDNTRTATITRAMLVNLYNQPTYILKRVATDANGTGLSYLGDETTDNYVIDPNTASKTVPATDETADWYDRYFPNLTDEVDSDGKTVWEGWLAEGDEITNPDDNTDTWRRIGYAKENTSSIDAQGENYSTGVVFEAVYGNLGDGFTQSATFFRVNKSTLYPTLEAAMTAHDTGFDENKTFNSLEELKTYITSLDGNDLAGYKTYLQTATDGENLAKYQWSNFKQNVLGYNGTVPTAKTRQVLHERSGNKIETFLGGRGYYTYWIKHNCGDASASVPGLPMENAIVRNNIYKLIVKSISKIGSDIPNNEEPEEPKVSIEVKLVDSWYVVYDMEVE